MNCIKGKEHEFDIKPNLAPSECKHCGLLKSTIEAMERADGNIGHDVSGTESVRRPKQSTELEELLREFYEECEYDGNWAKTEPEDIRKFLTKAYQSGHTAGQAAVPEEVYYKIEDAAYRTGKRDGQAEERDRVKKIIQGMWRKVSYATPTEYDERKEISVQINNSLLKDILSSLNKD